MPMQAVHEFEAVAQTGSLSKTLAPYALILILSARFWRWMPH